MSSVLLSAMAKTGSGWSFMAVIAVFCASLIFQVALGATPPEPKLTTTCKDNAECEYYILGSSCIANNCVCKDGSVISGDGSSCLEAASGFGAVCIDDTQCAATLGSGGSCSNSKCTCSAGHHYVKGQCWRSIPLDGPCFNDDQCYGAFDFMGFQCQDGSCQCRSKYYRRGDGCRRESEMDEACVIDSDCASVGGFCNSTVNGFCNPSPSLHKITDPKRQKIQIQNPIGRPILRDASCAPGYFQKVDVCVPELGTECTASENDACAVGITYSKCIDNRVCGCDASSRARSLDNRACNKVARVIEQTTCIDDGQCTTFGSNSNCTMIESKKVCSCVTGSHFDKTDLICRKSRLIGETCEIDGECLSKTQDNVACVENKCTCKENTHVADNGSDCRPDGISVGSSCIENTDCMFDNSICNSTLQQCQCSEHYFAEERNCVRGVGSPCDQDVDCSHISQSSCSTEKACQCQSNYVSSVNYDSCLPVVNVTEACLQTDQCSPSMGPQKECKEGICSCQDGSQYILGRCYLMRQLGEKCSARAECVAPGGNPEAYMCQNGICNCQYGHRRNGDICE